MNAELELLNKNEADLKWFVKHESSLTEEFDNKFVAIENEKVVESDKNIKNLVEKLKAKDIDPTITVVQFVSKTKIIF